MNYHRSRMAYPWLIASLLIALIGCQKPIAPPTREPLQVTVALPVQKDVQLYHEFTGRTVAVERVDIRARVQGFLEKTHFEDSDQIKDGQFGMVSRHR